MSSSLACLPASWVVRCRRLLVVVMLAGAWICASGLAQGADATKENPAKEKPAVAKPAATKPVEAKSPEEKPSDKKPGDAKPAAKKVVEKPTDQKPDAKKVDLTKPTDQKPDAKKTDAKNTESKKPAAKKYEQPLTPGGKYRAHDMQRPRPLVVTPPTPATLAQPAAAPSDAIVLFDGKSLEAWLIEGRDPKTKQMLTTPAAWPVRDGYMEVPPRSAGSRGTIVTREEFGSCQLHLEFATPTEVSGSGQGRGNSGILLHGVCEVQVLDSFENDTYPDGQAAAIYSSYPPLVNASRKPGQWQTYDIILELARPVAAQPVVTESKGASAATTAADAKKPVSTKPVDAAKKIMPTKPKLRPARITVLHNGVIVQHAEELASTATKFKIALQDHGNPVRYRNIWIRPLKERE